MPEKFFLGLCFSAKKSHPFMEAGKHTKTSKTFLKRRIVMKKLGNTCKLALGLGLWVVCLGGSYVAGKMVGVAVGEWAANKLIKEG